MTLDTTLVTIVSGFSGATAAAACGVWTEDIWGAIIGDTILGDAAASERASANTATGPACSAVTAGSATDWTVRADAEVVGSACAFGDVVFLVDFDRGAGVGSSLSSGVFVGSVVGSGLLVGSVVPVLLDVPVLVCALTTTPPLTVFVVVFDDAALPSDSVVTVVVDGSVAVWVLAVVFVLVSVDPVVDDVSGGELAVSSAEAMPCPVAIAVPTPNATASPPTRPM
jgi:hypothetical protein